MTLLHVCFGANTRQIDQDEYLEGRNSGHRDDYYKAPAAQMDFYSHTLEGHNWRLLDAQRNSYWYAPPSPGLPGFQVDDQRWSTFLGAVAEFFLNDEDTTTYEGMEQMNPAYGLPLFHLAAFTMSSKMVFSPDVTRRIYADLVNLGSDGADQDFLNYVSRTRRGIDADSLIDNLFEGLSEVVDDNPMLLIV